MANQNAGTQRTDGVSTRSKPFGLVGGLGPPSTVYYYLELLKAFKKRETVPRLIVAHSDMAHALDLVAANDKATLAMYLASFIHSLSLAGAEFVAIPAVTPHICIPELRTMSDVPIIDIVDVLTAELEARGVERLAVLGTRFTMEQRLFGRLDTFDLLDLSLDTITEVHRIYMAIAASGSATERDTLYLKRLCFDLCTRGAQAIAIAGTELSLVFEDGDEDIPLLDCGKAHISAITAAATG